MRHPFYYGADGDGGDAHADGDVGVGGADVGRDDRGRPRFAEVIGDRDRGLHQRMIESLLLRTGPRVVDVHLLFLTEADALLLCDALGGRHDLTLETVLRRGVQRA